jgi:DMSO/TMAO reductase YedYZ molybdopterin-dependent catalytic subunit
MTRRTCVALTVLLLAPACLFPQAKGNPSAPAPNVDISTWRLRLVGPALASPIALSYEELRRLPAVAKREYLVCPGLFAHSADYEGVPLSAVLERGKAAVTYTKITFTALDGYSVAFTREEVESSNLFLALKFYGKTLPPAEGYPVRLVAGGFSGGRWVRWLSEIRVE